MFSRFEDATLSAAHCFFAVGSPVGSLEITSPVSKISSFSISTSSCIAGSLSWFLFLLMSRASAERVEGMREVSSAGKHLDFSRMRSKTLLSDMTTHSSSPDLIMGSFSVPRIIATEMRF